MLCPASGLPSILASFRSVSAGVLLLTVPKLFGGLDIGVKNGVAVSGRDFVAVILHSDENFFLSPSAKIYITVFQASKYLILVIPNVLKVAWHNHTDYSRGRHRLCEEGGRSVGRGHSHRRTRGRWMKRLLSALTRPCFKKSVFSSIFGSISCSIHCI